MCDDIWWKIQRMLCTFPSSSNLEYVKRKQKPICSFRLVHCRGYFVLALNIIVVNTRFWRKQLKEKTTLSLRTFHIRMEMSVKNYLLICSGLQRVSPPPEIRTKSLEVFVLSKFFWPSSYVGSKLLFSTDEEMGLSDLSSFSSTDLGQPQPPGKFTSPLRNNTFVGHKTDLYCWSNASKYVSCYFRNCYKVATNCNCNNSHRKQMELTPSRTQAEASALLAFWLIWIKSLGVWRSL